jgi:hypothetical protein
MKRRPWCVRMTIVCPFKGCVVQQPAHVDGAVDGEGERKKPVLAKIYSLSTTIWSKSSNRPSENLPPASCATTTTTI